MGLFSLSIQIGQGCLKLPISCLLSSAQSLHDVDSISLLLHSHRSPLCNGHRVLGDDQFFFGTVQSQQSDGGGRLLRIEEPWTVEELQIRVRRNIFAWVIVFFGLFIS